MIEVWSVAPIHSAQSTVPRGEQALNRTSSRCARAEENPMAESRTSLSGTIGGDFGDGKGNSATLLCEFLKQSART